MKKEVYYYYLRNEEQKPYGCVAISENEDGTINRGVSICSTTDIFLKKCARGLAFKRMKEAVKNKNTVHFNRYNSYAEKKPLCPADFEALEFDTKSAYAVTPTAKEYRMLHKPEDI